VALNVDEIKDQTNASSHVKKSWIPKNVHRYSWVSLFVCWLIWIINAFDREIILRLGPSISEEFHLSPEAWGSIVSLIMLALAVLDIPGSILSDRYGSGWKRARFQVPLVLGYNAISFISGFRGLTSNLTSFIALRVGVNLGAGWGEPVGVSNTAEWWPVENRGFALGVHHTGYPVGALLSGLAASYIIATFGSENWRYGFFIPLIAAIPVMLFWAKYSTAERINTLYNHIEANGLTKPDLKADVSLAKGEGFKVFIKTLKNKNVSFTACNTLLTQIVYMGINVVLTPYLHYVVGFSMAASAGLSIVFTLTGVFGQIIWPWLSDFLGRKWTLIICGLWMSAGIASFYFATNMPRLIVVQLLFGLVANAVWPIYYAMASDSAEQGANSTANGIITTAMFIGGGIAPVFMGWLITLGGGWESATGYVYTFFAMAACALTGVVMQLFTVEKAGIYAKNK
jgi:MFS family permease